MVGCSSHSSVPDHLILRGFSNEVTYQEQYHLAKPETMSLKSLSRQINNSVTYRYGVGEGDLNTAKEVILMVKKSAKGEGARSFTEAFDQGCQLYQHLQESIQGLLTQSEVMACEPKHGRSGMVVANKSIRGPYHWFVATYYIPIDGTNQIDPQDFESLPVSPDQRFHLHQFLTQTHLQVTP